MGTASAAVPIPALPGAIRRLVDRLSAQPSVQRVILFGSRARGDAGPRSDVDLAIEAPGISARDWLRLTEMAEEADTLLSIDLVRVEDTPEDLRARIGTEGRTLHER